MTKHLYIHIPFCSSLCWFCDFKRNVNKDSNLHLKYVKEIIEKVKLECVKKQFKTIYIGGGTPNLLDDEILDILLSKLKEYLDDEYEFSIECNPEYITESQLNIFKVNKINRVSLGIQTFNDLILKQMNRTHNSSIAIEAIKLIKKKFNNFSCDFIYNYPNMNINDLKQVFYYINKFQVPHISFYALEIKDNAILNKINYKIDEFEEEKQLIYIQNMFKKLKYKRYEISNWAINNKFYSLHNLTYWNYNDWKAIGIGAVGLENRENYEYKNEIGNWIKESIELTDEEYYLNILIMGLRKIEGLDLNIEKNKIAFDMYKTKLKNYKIINNFLKADNLDCLNDTIIELF